MVWVLDLPSQEHYFISFLRDGQALENSLVLNKLTRNRCVSQNDNWFAYTEQYIALCNGIVVSVVKYTLLPSKNLFLGNDNKIR
jgi:hypothetical protein